MKSGAITLLVAFAAIALLYSIAYISPRLGQIVAWGGLGAVALMLLMRFGRSLAAYLWKNIAWVARGVLAAGAIAAVLTPVIAGMWHSTHFAILFAMASPGCILWALNRADRQRRHVLLRGSPEAGVQLPLRALQRARGRTAMIILIIGSGVAVAIVWGRAPDIWLFVLMAAVVAALMVEVTASRLIHRRPAQERLERLDQWFARRERDDLPHRALTQVVEFLSPSSCLRSAWRVDSCVSILFFEYASVRDAIAVAVIAAATPPGRGAVVSLPHPLQRDPISDAGICEAFRLPSGRGESWSLLADSDCYERFVTPAVTREIGRGPEGELWGWLEGHMFCLWLGPLQGHEVRELAERCRTLAGVVGQEAGAPV